MKKFFVFLSVLALAAAGAHAQTAQEESTKVKAGQMAPDFTVTMLDGRQLSLAQLRGKVVVLNFWATWCPPCQQEFRRVQADLVERYAGRDFVFLPISRGERRDVVAKFMESREYTFPVGLDENNKIFELYARNYIPRNFVIDGNGRVYLATLGYTPEEFDGMLDLIDALLGGQPAGK